MPTKKAHNQIKIILVGEGFTGKTSIIHQAMINQFKEDVDVTSVPTQFSYAVQTESNEKVIFDIWDTAGQEKFRTVNMLFFKNAQVALLVYDITNRKSFEELKNFWFNHVKEHANKNVLIGIIGNKSDLFVDEQVTESEAKLFSDSIGAFLLLVSAKTGLGIKEIFKLAAERVIETNPNEIGSTSDVHGKIKLKPESKVTSKKKKKKFCS